MFGDLCNRRTFLKTSLLGALVLCSSMPAFAKVPIEEQLPEGKLSLYNTHNSERLTITYRNASGDYDIGAINALNWILRCHYTQQVADMDVRVIEYLNLVDKRLGGNNEIHIISGYRSPVYNSLLRQEGRHVAKHSLHLKGKAIDIAIPGIGLDRVRHTALNLRYGGVGYYPKTGFVHVDSGNFRTW